MVTSRHAHSARVHKAELRDRRGWAGDISAPRENTHLRRDSRQDDRVPTIDIPSSHPGHQTKKHPARKAGNISSRLFLGKSKAGNPLISQILQTGTKNVHRRVRWGALRTRKEKRKAQRRRQRLFRSRGTGDRTDQNPFALCREEICEHTH